MGFPLTERKYKSRKGAKVARRYFTQSTTSPFNTKYEPQIIPAKEGS